MKMQAERKIEALEKENSELKEEIEQLKTKSAQFEVLLNATICNLQICNICNICNIINFTGPI